MRTTAAFLAAATSFAMPAQAALPPGIADLIEAAGETGDPAKVKTVAALARQLYPDDLAAIDALAVAARQRAAQIVAVREKRSEEQLRASSIFQAWDGRGELGGFRSTGNSSDSGIAAGLDLLREGIDWQHHLRAHVDYRRSDGDTTREEVSFAYEPNFRLSRRAFVYGLGQVERDRVQGYDLRTTVSGGLGYRIFDRDGLSLDIKAGPAWRYTDSINDDDENALSGLVALDGVWRVLEPLSLTQHASAIVDAQTKTLHSATGIEVRLAQDLLGRIAYVVDYESDPPVGAVNTDTQTRVTIVYDF